MKRLILEQSNDEFYTSHSGLALVGACINRYNDLGRQVGRLAGNIGQIAEIDILRSDLGLLCLCERDSKAITGMRNDDYFKQALGIGCISSAERLRQRLDEGAATGLIPLVLRSSQTMLKHLGVKVSGYPDGLVSLDVRGGQRRRARWEPVLASHQKVSSNFRRISSTTAAGSRLSSHSHTVMTRQPRSDSSSTALWSRSTVP